MQRTWQINKALQEALERRRPPVSSGKKAKAFYATQIDIAPPTIVIFVNEPGLFSKEYRRFLANRFRQTLPFSEVPIKLIFRAREKVDLPKRKRKG